MPDGNLGTPEVVQLRQQQPVCRPHLFRSRHIAFCHSSAQVEESVETLSSTWLSAALIQVLADNVLMAC